MSATARRYVLLLVLVALVGVALAVPPTRYGDASEYVMATMSLVFDRDLLYEEKDLLRAVAMRPEGTDIPAGLQVVRTSEGIYRFGGHTIYYPLLAAPFYLAMGYRGFYVLNALLFWLVLVALSRRHGPRGGLVVSLLALVPSASFCYLFWTTPENAIFCFFALSLFLWERERCFLSGAALGVAAAMKFPLALFGVAFLIVGFGKLKWRGRTRFAAGFLLLFLPQLTYNLVALRCPHATFLTPEDSSSFLYFRRSVPYCEGFTLDRGVRVMHRWTDAAHFSPARLLASLVDPSMGLVWFYPLVPCLLAATRWKKRQLWLAGASLVCLAVFCSVQRFFTHQVGFRALNYLYPALLFLPARIDLNGRTRRVLVAWALVWGATFAVFPLENSRDQLERKPIPAYRLWADLREKLDERFFFERHRMAPGFAATHVYPDGWTVGESKATLVCAVQGEQGDLELTIRAADRPWQRVRWRAGNEWRELSLRGGGTAVLRVPVPPGETLLRIELEAEGFCPKGRVPRSLGVRLLTVVAGQDVLYEAGG